MTLYLFVGFLLGGILGFMVGLFFSRGREKSAYEKGKMEVGNQLAVELEKLSIMKREHEEQKFKLEVTEKHLNDERKLAIELSTEKAVVEERCKRIPLCLETLLPKILFSSVSRPC